MESLERHSAPRSKFGPLLKSTLFTSFCSCDKISLIVAIQNRLVELEHCLPMSSGRSVNDYTVGWVCALPKEQTAAMAMLDQRHADLPKPPNDHNTYTLGTIGKHNVAIACLPKGKVGTSSAATVATQMISTFPAIQFGLMVGIGGGVPP